MGEYRGNPLFFFWDLLRKLFYFCGRLKFLHYVVSKNSLWEAHLSLNTPTETISLLREPRPLSLLSCLPKFFEKSLIRTHNLIPAHHFGSREKEEFPKACKVAVKKRLPNWSLRDFYSRTQVSDWCTPTCNYKSLSYAKVASEWRIDSFSCNEALAEFVCNWFLATF